MSRQLLLSGHTIRCDVGYGLAAGDGERVAVTPVAVSNAALGACGSWSATGAPGSSPLYFDAPIHCQRFRRVGLAGSGW